MSRYARKTDPALPKVEHIELDQKRPKLRLALTIVMLVIGLGFLGYALYGVINRAPGWQEITVSSGAALNCAQDLTLVYEFQGNATVESKQLTPLYTEATERAYALFQPRQEIAGIRNLALVNASPNVPTQIESELYEALSLVLASGSREMYLAPIYAEYEQIFHSSSSYEAAAFDPFTDPEQQAYFAEVLAYINDPAHVELELLGEDTVCLHVSDDYLRFAEDYAIDAFLDFFWMKNAFIVDYIASVLQENGFTRAVLTSFDGFCRNLDTRGETSVYNLMDLADGAVRLAAQADYAGPCAMVSLQAFPVTDSFSDYYGVLPSGEVRTAYIDLADGLCRTAASTLLGRSETASCAQILMRLVPLYIADSLDADALDALKDEGIRTLYCADLSIVCNDPQVTLREVYHDYTVK